MKKICYSENNFLKSFLDLSFQLQMDETTEGLASIQTLDRSSIGLPISVLDMLQPLAQNNAEKYTDDVYGTSEPNLKGNKEEASKKERHKTGKHKDNINLICFEFQVQVSSDLDDFHSAWKTPILDQLHSKQSFNLEFSYDKLQWF